MHTYNNYIHFTAPCSFITAEDLAAISSLVLWQQIHDLISTKK